MYKSLYIINGKNENYFKGIEYIEHLSNQDIEVNKRREFSFFRVVEQATEFSLFYVDS